MKAWQKGAIWGLISALGWMSIIRFMFHRIIFYISLVLFFPGFLSFNFLFSLYMKKGWPKGIGGLLLFLILASIIGACIGAILGYGYRKVRR